MRCVLVFLLVVASSCSENLSHETRQVASTEDHWKNSLDVLRNELEVRGATDFTPRLDAFAKRIDEATAEMRAAIAKGKRGPAQATVAKVTREVDAERDALERAFETWKNEDRKARRAAPFEAPAFLAELGSVARIETPKGHYLDREAQVDQLFDLERWVAFCKLTGGKLALTAPTSNAVLVRYRPDDDLEEKKAEAVERKRNSSILQLVGLLEAAGMREADFAEIRLQPSYGASGPYEVEVVEPCVQTPQRKKRP